MPTSRLKKDVAGTTREKFPFPFLEDSGKMLPSFETLCDETLLKTEQVEHVTKNFSRNVKFLVEIMSRRGALIVLEGIDRTGKVKQSFVSSSFFYFRARPRKLLVWWKC